MFCKRRARFNAGRNGAMAQRKRVVLRFHTVGVEDMVLHIACCAGRRNALLGEWMAMSRARKGRAAEKGRNSSNPRVAGGMERGSERAQEVALGWGELGGKGMALRQGGEMPYFSRRRDAL